MLRQKFQHLPTNISVINISHQPQRKFHLNMQISFPPHKNRGADGVLGLTFQLFAAFHKKWFEKRVGSGLKANTLIEKFTHIPHPLWKCCMYAGMLTIANIVGQLWQAIKFRLGQHFVAQLAESASDLQAAKRRSTPGWQQTSHQPPATSNRQFWRGGKWLRTARQIQIHLQLQMKLNLNWNLRPNKCAKKCSW